MANNILVVFAVEKALPPPVSQQDSSVSVHDEAQVDVVINAELAGETAIATSANECPAGEVDHADHDVTEEWVTDNHCEEPPMQQQDGIGVGMSINEGDNAMDQLAATVTEHHFNDVLKQLPVQTIPTDSDTTGGTMGMSTTTFSPPSQLQTLVNVNDGKCNVFDCCNSVFTACQSCNEFLCYDHTSSSCSEHSQIFSGSIQVAAWNQFLVNFRVISIRTLWLSEICHLPFCYTVKWPVRQISYTPYHIHNNKCMLIHICKLEMFSWTDSSEWQWVNNSTNNMVICSTVETLALCSLWGRALQICTWWWRCKHCCLESSIQALDYAYWTAMKPEPTGHF